MKNTFINSVLYMLVFGAMLILPMVLTSASVSAEAGSRLKSCLDMPEANNQREICLGELEQGAIEACVGKSDVEKCKKDFKNGRPSESAPVYAEKGDCNETDINADNCGIVKYIVIAINTLTALAGVAIVGSIIYGGIQYSMAGSDPQKVAMSKDRIRNAFIALILLLFGFAILNYLVPGGVLR